jgi:hypothetical protein
VGEVVHTRKRGFPLLGGCDIMLVGRRKV